MKILVAEDNPVFQAMLRSILSDWGYQVEVAKDGDEAWQKLRGEGGPQLVILDWMMPGIDGLEVCRRVRAHVRDRYVYVLFLTARTSQTDIVEGIDAGADEYVTKPFKLHELRARLRSGCRILALEQELIQAREALRAQATQDALTQVWNRASIMQRLQQELARASRTHSPVAVIMADLDYFKHINDTKGHLTGDAVLREAVDRMKAAIRCYDSLGRYGGEEFLVVLPGTNSAGGLTQAERLRDAIAADPFLVSRETICVTCSFGVAAANGENEYDLDRVIRSADDALYIAKRKGRNRIELSKKNLAAQSPCGIIRTPPS